MRIACLQVRTCSRVPNCFMHHQNRSADILAVRSPAWESPPQHPSRQQHPLPRCADKPRPPHPPRNGLHWFGRTPTPPTQSSPPPIAIAYPYPPGYNFPTLASITPHLEPTTSGPSTVWAKATALRLNCFVCVGYPETTPSARYNSAVLVDPHGNVVVNYRKHFLFTTDEIWASEGPERFYSGDIPGLGKIAMGICT